MKPWSIALQTGAVFGGAGAFVEGFVRLIGPIEMWPLSASVALASSRKHAIAFAGSR